jgi:hypothetical protein
MDSPKVEKTLKDVFEIILDVIGPKGNPKINFWRRLEKFRMRGRGKVKK